MPIVSVQNFINRRNAKKGHGGQPMADKGSMFDVLHHTCQVCLNHQENNRIDEDVFRNCLLETLRDNHIFSPNTDDYSQLSNSDQNYIKEPINMLLFWNAIRKENNQYLILRHALLEQFALSLRDALAMTFLLNQQLWNLIIEFTPTPQDLEDLPEYALWPRPPHKRPQWMRVEHLPRT